MGRAPGHHSLGSPCRHFPRGMAPILLRYCTILYIHPLLDEVPPSVRGARHCHRCGRQWAGVAVPVPPMTTAGQGGGRCSHLASWFRIRWRAFQVGVQRGRGPAKIERERARLSRTKVNRTTTTTSTSTSTHNRRQSTFHAFLSHPLFANSPYALTLQEGHNTKFAPIEVPPAISLRSIRNLKLLLDPTLRSFLARIAQQMHCTIWWSLPPHTSLLMLLPGNCFL